MFLFFQTPSLCSYLWCFYLYIPFYFGFFHRPGVKLHHLELTMKKNLIYSKFHGIVLVLTTEYWNNNFLPAGRLEFFFPHHGHVFLSTLGLSFILCILHFPSFFGTEGSPRTVTRVSMGWWLLRLTFKILANLRLTVNAFPLFPSDIFFTANFFYA